jgi:hypothetical protein
MAVPLPWRATRLNHSFSLVADKKWLYERYK